VSDERLDQVLVEAQLEHVLDRVHDGVILTGAGGATPNAAARRILALPEGAELLSGLFEPRALDGTPFVVGPEQKPGEVAAEGGTGGPFRIRVTALDGRELVLDGSVSLVAGGTVIVFRDVTDEHLRNERNEHTLSALFESLPVAVGVIDPATRALVKVNAAFCSLVGRTPDDVVGVTPPYPWSDPGTEFDEAVGTTIDRVFRLPDGRPRPVEISTRAIAGDDGETALLLALIKDTSDDRRLQQQLVQSGKLAAIGELAAGVAHEINNPLFAILGLTEFLLKEAEPESKAHQRLELIQQTGLEIKEIVRALLDFARENADERHEVALDDVVRSTVDLVRRTNAHKGVELVDSYEDSGALVMASPNQLKQIFLNLIANARQAMPNGGNVTIDVRTEGNFAIATVGDDGPGIPPDIVSRIFEPFFTTKRNTGGTGLGLSVSLGIAEAHGGVLTVQSEVGHGTQFSLRLPLYDDEEALR
jgi:PAS domain S-box-containing protein